MKRLGVSAAVASLGVALLGSVSCSSTPPPPAPMAQPRSLGAERGILAQCLPYAVSNRQAAILGAASPSQRMKLEIQLPLRNQAELTRLLRDIYDTRSPDFHHYLTVSAFTERFGPTASDYDKVVSWAKSKGFNVTGTTPNRRLVAVEGTVETVNQAFSVSVNNYRHPNQGRTFFSADREPTAVGLAVPILQVTGLNNYALPHPMLKRGVPALAAGSGPSGEYLPSDMRAAYYGNGPLTGAGQTIGILSFDGYLATDVQLYYSKTGMSSNVPVKNVLVAGFNGACTSSDPTTGSTCDDGEQVLDIVNAIGMAPGIQQILFYEGTNDTQILNQMATDNLAKILSSSWGWNPADAASDDPIFQEFAAQGQSFVTASGDNGAYDSATYSFPGVDPYVTEVGGTDLTTTGPGGAWTAETAWPQSGGGNVSGTPIPAWQQLAGVINATNQGSTSLRNSPDVAAEANFDNPTVVNGSFATGYGGTSFATPRWAGFLALVNQQSVANGHGTVGFINPAIYAIGVSSSYPSAFHDITSGSNPPTSGSSPTGFSAVPGYDLVTGWGSPTGAGLIDLLAGASTGAPQGR